MLGFAVQTAIEKKFGGSREAAGAFLGEAPSQMSRLMTGHYEEFSTDRLCTMLVKLGAHIEVVIRMQKALRRGRARIRVASL